MKMSFGEEFVDTLIMIIKNYILSCFVEICFVSKLLLDYPCFNK